MNLTTLKAQAEAAKTDSVELELWRESIEPDEFLRLVKVARVAKSLLIEIRSERGVRSMKATRAVSNMLAAEDSLRMALLKIKL